MERQFRVAELAIPLDQRTAQHRLDRRALAAGLLDALSPKDPAPPGSEARRAGRAHCDMAFKPRPISCPAKGSKMLAWMLSSWRIAGSGGWASLQNRSLDLKCTAIAGPRR